MKLFIYLILLISVLGIQAESRLFDYVKKAAREIYKQAKIQVFSSLSNTQPEQIHLSYGC